MNFVIAFVATHAHLNANRFKLPQKIHAKSYSCMYVYSGINHLQFNFVFLQFQGGSVITCLVSAHPLKNVLQITSVASSWLVLSRKIWLTVIITFAEMKFSLFATLPGCHVCARVSSKKG